MLGSMCLLIGATPRATAQTAPLVLEAPASTEAMAFGNAPNLQGQDASLLFYGPAFLAGASGASFGFQRFGSDGTLASVAAATEQNDFGLAVGLQYLSYGADDLARAQDIQSVALGGGALGVDEFVASVGLSRELLGLETGVVLKWVEQSVDRSNDHTVAFDVGVGKDLGPIVLGLTTRNLGSNLEPEPVSCPVCDPASPTSAAGLELPSLVALGLTSDEFEVGALDMFFTTQVMRRRDGEVIPAGGVELSYWPLPGYTFRLRAGAQRVVEDRRSPLTFGAAFTGDRLTIEYAYQAFDDDGELGSSSTGGHRFGFRWR